MGANHRWFPAPMPRLDSERLVAVGLAAGRPGHSARLVGPLIRRGWSARSLGTGPLVAAAGAPMAGPASPPPRPAHPGRGMRRRWSAPRTRNAQCPSIRIRVPQWNHLAREHLNPGRRNNGHPSPSPSSPDPQQLGAPASTSDSQPAATAQPAAMGRPTSVPSPASKATRRQQWGERTASPTPWFLITHRIGPSHSSEVQS